MTTPTSYVADPIDPAEDEGKVMDYDLQSRVKRLLEDARHFNEEELAPARALATKYYKGEPFGNEEDGRSQFVMTVLRDAVGSIMPDLMRMFTGPERTVEYRPTGPEDEALAEQQTEYVQHIVLMQDNPGFRIIWDWLTDALVRRMGVVKYWWETTPRTEGANYSGLLQEQLIALATDPNTEVREIAQEMDGTWSAEVIKTFTTGRVRIAVLPPEEFLYNRSAKCVEDAILTAHLTEKTPSELRQMGYPEEVIDRAKFSQRITTEDEIARNERGIIRDDPAQDDENAPILYAEAYILLPSPERPGITELRKVCCIGSDYTVVADEPAPEAPFVTFVPKPEPHTMQGQGPADDTMDLQRLDSSIMRGILDSLNLTLNPRTEIVEGQVNLQDVLNTEIGAIIRAKTPGMMREVTHRFVGADALPMLSYTGEIRQNRLGISRAAEGLDPDALQSSTPTAVAGTFQEARKHLEMLARMFAESVAQLFKGIYRLLTRHQDQARTVRLRNRYVPVDPRTWNAECDVTVNVALGAGMIEQKVQILRGIAAEQKEILATLGPQNPIVDLSQYRNTLARMAELLGEKDSTKFFKVVDPQQLAVMAQQAAQNQPPDPALLLAQAEAQKVQTDAQYKQAQLALEHKRLLLQDDRERDKIETDMLLKAWQIEVENNVKLDTAMLQATVNKSRSTET